ncbi:hypothetical protein [Fusobacterium periodonticum]|uniref:Uncharacterized protein n=1 Tax=Fusobacterium periodonticum ATCC 33693 TaxID=546275 RepID=D4CXG9_9FUSO|nr:hypothetical protein [Fusobacterium periodonticum]EFE86089.1 hypothetical protein FUSPEROL_02130 [Fusobacterium periodonticum ATCC 33693]
MMKVIEKYTKHENVNYEFFTTLVLNGIEKYDKIFDKTELIIKKRKPKDIEKNISYANLRIKYKVKWIFNENDFKNILDGIDNSNFIKSYKIQYINEILNNNEIPETTKNKIKLYLNL